MSEAGRMTSKEVINWGNTKICNACENQRTLTTTNPEKP